MFGRRRKRAERELEDELQFHLEQAADRYGSRGRAEAVLGGSEATKEACRDERAGAWLASVGRDLKLGARILRKSPGFTAAAVGTLGLCIACVIAIFGVYDAALLRTPPFPQPNRILVLTAVNGGQPAPFQKFRVGDYADFRAGASAFSGLAGYYNRSFNLAGQGQAAHVGGMVVAPDFFKVLGIAPARGRTFLANEDQPGHAHEVVLSDGLWRKQFGAAPMLGKTILLNGDSYTVVGIMPASFAHGVYELQTQFWVPLVAQYTNADEIPVYAIGRLRPGATLAAAQGQIEAIARHEAAVHPEEKGTSATALTFREWLSIHGNNPAALALFLTLAGLILLIGCANVAGLGLGRAAARGDEMAIRRALGAGRARLVRQVLTESTLLAVLAGALGVLLGWMGMALLNAGLPVLGAQLDPNVWAVAVAAVVLTALCSGLPPALRTGTRAQARGVISSRSRGRDVLVAAEIALTLASLIAIAVVVQGIEQEWNAPLGFNPNQVLSAQINLSGAAFKTEQAQAGFITRMQAAAAALPGVRAAALGSPPPLAWNESRVAVRGRPKLDWQHLPMPMVFAVTQSYLETLRIPLLAGREFGASDSAQSAPVALISRSAARRLFPDGVSPIGRFIRLDAKDEPWREIVGETGDTESYMGDTRTNGDIFEPLTQVPHTDLGLVVRTAAGIAPDALTPALRHALAHIDSAVALYGAQPLSTELQAAGAGAGLMFLHVFELLGTLALLLSAIGLYCVVAYAAAARRREIGIRMALGASPPQIQRVLSAGALRITAIGLAMGSGLGWAGMRVLFASEDASPGPALWRYVIPIVVLAVVAALASWLPARRAARADPLAALRVE